MGDSGVAEDDIIVGQIDWDHMFHSIPDSEGLNFFDVEVDPSLLSGLSPRELSIPSPDSVPLSIGEIEHLLMNDDDCNDKAEPNHEPSNDFFSDLLLDSPGDSDPSVSDRKILNASEEEKIDVAQQNDANEDDDNNNNNNGDGDDPIAKKRKRQLRNRDAAVRSRERKKIYVRDLELKSRYLEGECKRLGMLLQCCFAENQALRLSLQNSKAFDASITKQESAVLLLESLLLGSLLWFLGIMCLLVLPGPLRSTLVAVPLGNVDTKNWGSLAPRKAGSKNFGLLVLHSFMMGKRCKASRSRMKSSSIAVKVFAILV